MGGIRLLNAVLLLQGVASFQPATCPGPSVLSQSASSVASTSTSTALFGLRSSLKRRILSPFRDNSFSDENTTTQLDSTTLAANNTTTTHELVPPSVPVSAKNSDKETSPNENTKNESEDCPILSKYPTEALYVMPDVEAGRQLTELEVEFRDMLGDFCHYTARDILSLKDINMRILFQGIVASAGEPEVYRAFEVLFEDLLPLRLGGRVIYRKLKKMMEVSVQEQHDQVDIVAQATRLPKKSVREARWRYLAVAMPLNGDAYLTHEQLRATGLTDTAVNLLGFDSTDAFLQRIDSTRKQQQHQHIEFTQLMLGLHQCAEEVCALEACNAAETVRTVVLDLVEHPPSLPTSPRDEKRQRNSDRYDEMVASFRDWEGLMPTEEDDRKLSRRQLRNIEVIRGCFVGTENPQVVDALRVLYTDYSPLRVAGDIIYGIVSSLMKKRAKNREITTTSR